MSCIPPKTFPFLIWHSVTYISRAMFDMIANTKYYFGKDENKTEKVDIYWLMGSFLSVCTHFLTTKKKKRYEAYEGR